MVLSRGEINKIVQLRKTGHSLPEIRRLTRHSNGTIFKYIQGIKVKSEFLEVWRNRQKTSVYRKIQDEQKAKDEISSSITGLDREEKMLIAASLYWAEGAKRDFALINTDPLLIKVFIRCLLEFRVSRNDLGVSLRLYSDVNREKAVRFWAEVTGVPSSRISYITILKGKKNGKLQYGMCRVRVKKGGYVLKLFHQLRQKIIELSVP